MISIPEHLRKLAARMMMAFRTPDEIIKALEIFRSLFRDDANFIPHQEWTKDTPPFTLSAKGHQEIESLRSDEIFGSIYRGGTAGMKKPYHLIYFLTQVLILLAASLESLELKACTEKDNELLKSLEKKLIKILPSLVSKEKKLVNTPREIASQGEYNKVKKGVLDTIDQLVKDYKGVKLTPEEREYWAKSLKP